MINDLIYCRNQADFIESIFDTVKQRDGILLEELLNVTRMCQINDLDFNNVNEPNVDQPLPNDHDLLWKLLSQCHWIVVRSLHMNDTDRAFRYQLKKFCCLCSILSLYSSRSVLADDDTSSEQTIDEESSWLLPVFNRHAVELRLIASLVNDGLESDSIDTLNSTIHLCNNQLLQALTTTQKFSSTTKMKKLGIFIIVNQMFKIYSALNKFNLFTFQIQRVERSFRQYMRDESAQKEPNYISYVLTYRYFLGKYHLSKHEYTLASEDFQYVFTNCLSPNISQSMKNKRQALLYLVVSKMLCGLTPKMEILEKYELFELIDLIEQVRQGSLKTFLDKIREYEKYLLNTGLLFIIENFKLITIRNLFRNYIYKIDQQQTNKIPLEPTLLSLLNFGFEQENFFHVNELIDILNNMMEKGMIRGYLAYKARMLVVSKKDPFPKSFSYPSRLNDI